MEVTITGFLMDQIRQEVGVLLAIPMADIGDGVLVAASAFCHLLGHGLEGFAPSPLFCIGVQLPFQIHVEEGFNPQGAAYHRSGLVDPAAPVQVIQIIH